MMRQGVIAGRRSIVLPDPSLILIVRCLQIDTCHICRQIKVGEVNRCAWSNGRQTVPKNELFPCDVEHLRAILVVQLVDEVALLCGIKITSRVKRVVQVS